MIQAVARPLDENHIPLRIHIGPKIKEHLARVVHIHLRIHRHDHFGEHHLPRTPQPVHQLKRLIGVLLF